MSSCEAAAVTRSIGPGPTSGFWAHLQYRKKRFLLPAPIPLTRLHIQFHKGICISRPQDIPNLNGEYTEDDRTAVFVGIPSKLLEAEREEVKAVLNLFLTERGISKFLAAATVKKSDSFIDHLVSELHREHKLRYMMGRELTTIEIRSTLFSYLESLPEEHGDLLIDMVKNFSDPTGTTSDRTDSIS